MEIISIDFVAVGKWNPHIFTPEWLIKQVVDITGVTVEDLKETVNLSFNLQEMNAAVLIKDLIILPSYERLIIKTENEENLDLLEKMTKSILIKLPETPIIAFGLNFSFIDEVIDKKVLNILKNEITKDFAVKEIKENKKTDKFEFNKFYRYNESNKPVLLVNFEFRKREFFIETSFVELFNLAKGK